MSFRVVWKNLNVADLSLIRDIHSGTANLLDRDDIFRCSNDFIRNANGILVKFGSCDPFVLTKLYFTSFCMSFYGCAVWSLDSCAVKHLDVCMFVKYLGNVTLAVFSPEFLGQRAQIISVTTPLILNVVILSTKRLLHVYHCQQRILSQVQCSQSSVIRAQTVLKFK